MIDYLGNKLEVGDIVVYITPGYRDYSKGRIIRFTKCFVLIEAKENFNKEIKQYSRQLIKI